MSKWLISSLMMFIIFTAWTFKNIWFSYEMLNESNILLQALSGLGLTMLLASIFLFSSRKINYIFSIFLYALVSILLYGDVVYERYYNDILSIKLLEQAGQAAEVGNSIVTLIQSQDIIYFMDLILLIILLSILLLTNKEPKRKSIKLATAAFCTGILGISSLTIFTIEAQYSNQYKVAKAGMLPAHIFNATKTLDENRVAPVLSKDTSIKELDEIKTYFNEKQKSQLRSPYYGIAKGKNLIIVQAESLNDFVINKKIAGQEITPNLNKLIKNSFYYNNIYTQIGKGNTSDAEFVVNNSLFPPKDTSGYKGYVDGVFQSLPQILDTAGYYVTASHGNRPEFWNRKAAYPAQGFEEFYSTNHPDIDASHKLGMGISDQSIFSQMTDIYKKQSERGNFFGFIITLSQHRPFELPDEYQYLDLPNKFNDTAVGDYLQSSKYADDALGDFIKKLKESGLWEETVFVYYGDHYGLLPDKSKQLKNLLGVKFDRKEMFNIPLIIHYPGQEVGETKDIIGGMVDIAPTVISLLGIKQDLYQVGVDLNSKEQGFVGFRHGFPTYSYFSDNYDFTMSPTGEFEQGSCIKVSSGKEVDVQNCREGYERIKKGIKMSDRLLENDLIKILRDGKL
ncbi:LTA synthase family protein [Pseudalkalibacillus decolorationis]|uniref:LTA synthase family protein n=1 Tax=Pseudalkalibacillus decolorationis TaxID=163879 RepID=UPI002148BCEB|nr:LTA synthase family protein [Pseudalkalibacillus decolorationis]